MANYLIIGASSGIGKRLAETGYMVGFLLSPKVSWITGQIISVVGGMSSLNM